MDTTISPTPAWRQVLRPLISPDTYKALTHHLLGLPLGTLYFVWLVTGISTGLGLVVTIVGIPLLTGVFATVRPLLAGERALANGLLGSDIPEAPMAPKAERGWLNRLKAYWTDSATWRGILYLMLRFPVGIATFTVAVTAWAAALWMLAAPIAAPFEGVELGIWDPDTVWEGLALVPLGLVLLLISAWINEGMTVASRAFARWGAR